MASFDYDLFVIGAGSGGVRASRVSASMGARVAVCEDDRLGGTCVNVGCVPKKLLVYASHYSHDFEEMKGFGWNLEGKVTHDWGKLIANKDNEINRLNGIYNNLLEKAGVELIKGRGTIVDKNTVEVAGKKYTAKYLLVAPGGWPNVPDIPGKEHVITSNEAFYLKETPKKVVIVGGGYIAVEFACIFAGLNCDVELVYRGPLFLRGFDEDVRTFLKDEMTKKGVKLRFNTNVTAVEKLGNGNVNVKLTDDTVVEANQCMYATGRNPKTAGLGCENAGIALGKSGEIIVDSYSRTNVENIYAIGDVTNRVALTPVAIKEGMAFANTVFGNNPMEPNHHDIPTAVFSQPPIGTVGLTQEAAEKKYGKDNLKIYKSDFRPLKHTLSGSTERSFMKLIVDTPSDRVVGVHICCPDAGEIIQGIGVAVKMGATKAQFDQCVGVHPTSAEELVTMR